jgi:hypothetical protein
MSRMVSNRRSTFGLNCVRCGDELVAPERSEYWNKRHIHHLWRCPKCDCCFATIVETDSTEDIMTGDDIFPSLLVA